MRVSTLVYSIIAGLAGFLAVTVIGRYIMASDSDNVFAMGTVATFEVAETPEPIKRIRFVDNKYNALTFRDFKGKTILVNLWATWCAPCLTELPDLDQLQRDLGSDNFEVVAISVDSSAVKAKAKFEELGLKSLTFYHDPKQALPKGLKAEHLPVNIIVGPRTRELGRMVGPAKWNESEAHKLIKALMKRARNESSAD
jgi:thiol-disulfide isomerase/thioredoxin